MIDKKRRQDVYMRLARAIMEKARRLGVLETDLVGLALLELGKMGKLAIVR
jgi:hypothetical protein